MEYLKIFFRRKWLFISPVFAGLVISIVACFLLPRAYESSTIILVEEEKLINPLVKDLAVSSDAVVRMQTIKEVLLGWNSLVELTKKLDLGKHVQNQKQFEGLIFSLRRNINLQMRGANLIKIAYLSNSPKEAQLVTQTLTDILIEQNKTKQIKETDVAIDFISEQLQLYKRKIKESEINAMEEKLKSLLIDSTEQHPMVKDLKEKVAKARKELDSGEYEIAESGKQATSPAREVLKQELDKMVTDTSATPTEQIDPGKAVYKLVLMDQIDSSLARDINVNESIYNMLLQKLETAKITQRLEASKEGTRYTIVDPPRLPLSPAKPNMLKVILVGLFLGAGAGAGLVFGKEFMDQSFLDIEDAKHGLNLPVLGAISRITTQEEINREKGKKKFLITVALIISVSLIIVSSLIYLFFIKK